MDIREALDKALRIKSDVIADRAVEIGKNMTLLNHEAKQRMELVHVSIALAAAAIAFEAGRLFETGTTVYGDMTKSPQLTPPFVVGPLTEVKK